MTQYLSISKKLDKNENKSMTKGLLKTHKNVKEHVKNQDLT